MKNQNRLTIIFFILITAALAIFPEIAVYAQEAAKKTKDTGGFGIGDIFEYAVIIGYLGGVFVLFPWIVYTNIKEQLPWSEEKGFEEMGPPDPNLSEEERNRRAREILLEIDKKLTTYVEDGEELITITKGKQARFIRNGLEYIYKNLAPTEQDIIDRVNEIAPVYLNRTERIFTGSKWIIGCSIFLGLFMLYMVGFTTFLIIHAIGIAFYIMSSRVPVYLFEKRINRYSRKGIIGGLMGGLFIGMGAKHYKKYSDGTVERDYDSELSGGALMIVLLVVAAMILGFLAAALGVVNFVMNYTNNAVMPQKPEKWYEKHFVMQKNDN